MIDVVAEMEKRGSQLTIGWNQVSFGHAEGEPYDRADQLPHAVCRAAIRMLPPTSAGSRG